MTELQKARQRWLDAEQRAIFADAEANRWKTLYFKAQQQLITQATQHAIDHITAPWLALSAEIRSKQP